MSPPALFGLDGCNGRVPIVPPAAIVAPELPNRRIAVLMVGPSLPSVWSHEKFDQYDLVVAVNTAIWTYRAHWLAAVDRPIYKKLWTLPQNQWPLIGCITSGRHEIEARKRNLQSEAQPLRVKTMRERHVKIHPPQGSVQCAYTGPNAIMFALMRCGRGGAVHVYGMDFSFDRLDYAGQKGTHAKSRWLAEGNWMRAIWDRDRIEVFGNIKPSVLAFLRGESKEMVWR